MERMSPTGPNRRLALELPPIKSADDAEAALQQVLEAFGRGEISIKELTHMLAAIGRLVRVDRKARTGRNPATGEAIKIPAKKVVKFRVAKAVKDAIVPPKPKK